MSSVSKMSVSTQSSQKEIEEVDEKPEREIPEEVSEQEIREPEFREILIQFVSKDVLDQAEKLLDLDQYTVEKSKSFVTWLCLLPLIISCKAIKSIVRFQISVMQNILRTIFPNLPVETKD